MVTHPNLKLTYFAGTGRAEISRLLFHYGKVSFVDERINGADFPALKPTLPLGQLPVLHVNGDVYPQSLAIARYAAKLSGLYPTDPVEALRVDMIFDTLDELTDPLVDIVFMEKDEAAKASKTKTFLEDRVPKMFTVLETLVQGTFFMGEKMTLADVQLFDVVQNKLIACFHEAFSLTAYSKLSSIFEKVKTNPEIAAYLASQ